MEPSFSHHTMNNLKRAEIVIEAEDGTFTIVALKCECGGVFYQNKHAEYECNKCHIIYDDCYGFV